MPARLDLTGKVFKRLTALKRDHSKEGPVWWICRCSCGKHVSVRLNCLRSGDIGSCGCLKKDTQLKHGKTNTVEYRTWVTLRHRCENPENKDFPKYGGRGIKVCDRWSTFLNFLADMGPRPSKFHSIDRKDNDGPYSPENCRWTTNFVQMNNRRNTTKIMVNGVTKSVSEWAEEFGIGYQLLANRIRRGWDFDVAVNTQSGGVK